MTGLAMAENPVLLDPRRHLQPAEITRLRQLDRAGVAIRTGSFVSNRGRGWLCDGVRCSDKAFRRFITLGLALEVHEDGQTRLRLTYTGRLVVERLRTRRVPGATPTDD